MTEIDRWGEGACIVYKCFFVVFSVFFLTANGFPERRLCRRNGFSTACPIKGPFKCGGAAEKDQKHNIAFLFPFLGFTLPSGPTLFVYLVVEFQDQFTFSFHPLSVLGTSLERQTCDTPTEVRFNQAAHHHRP